jgi:hypothetical protein
MSIPSYRKSKIGIFGNGKNCIHHRIGFAKFLKAINRKALPWNDARKMSEALMADQDLVAVFREKLAALAKEGKYARHFTREDEERVCQAFAMALQNPSITETLLFELLTGERA